MTADPKENYEVKHVLATGKEARRILKTPGQLAFCIHQAKLLRFFPTRIGKANDRYFNLDIVQVDDYWELRIWDKILPDKTIRIMFAPFSQPKDIFILAIYAKQSQKTPNYIKKRCKNRIASLEKQGYRR